MQYHCVQCNELFTLDPGEDKPRCPKCLRQHGLRPVERAQPKVERKAKWLPLLGLVVLAAAGGGYYWYQQTHSHPPGQVPLAPITVDELRADVKALTGADAGDLVRMLEADAHVEEFAARARAKQQNTPEAQAKAVVAALGERKQKQAYVNWPRVESREGPPLTASGAAQALAQDGVRKQLYPLEVAALGVAALRSVGVPALVAEVYRYPNERNALDPSGRLGYFAIALPKLAAAAEQIFDAYGQRSTSPAAGDYKLLNDAQVLGAALAIRGLERLENHSDSKTGLADSELAVKLSPSSPSVRSARATLLLASGGIEAGTRELDAAVQLRGDAARRNSLATLGLLTGNANGAAKELAAALAEAPDYALAHVTLATVHLMRDERDLARVELEKAEKLEPDLAMLPQIWAQFYASNNELDQALAKAQEAVRRRPQDNQALLVLARVDRAAGRYDDMRKQARTIMSRVSPDERERMENLLRGMLGPTVFADTPAADGDSAEGSSPSLSLSEDNSGSGRTGPRLLDPSSEPAQPGSLQLQPGAPKLQLGTGDSRLKLNLDKP